MVQFPASWFLAYADVAKGAEIAGWLDLKRRLTE